MNKDRETLDVAQKVAAESQSWADLSNALFDPDEGLVARAYPNRIERARFVKTKEYRAIRELIDTARTRHGLVEGAVPSQKSGRFVVRVPRTLHAALEQESQAEGVSLNQLVVTKLAIQISRLAGSSTPDMARIAQAYLEVRNGYSIDRVVADPALNHRYLNRCRELGVSGTDLNLNWKLLTGRKSNCFTDFPGLKYTPSRMDEFSFSSEMAIRHVQEQVRTRENRVVSLDEILCDPALAAEFDAAASRLAPGFTSLDYRWVALADRKKAALRARKAAGVKTPDFEFLGMTQGVQTSQIPPEQGIYLFRCDDESLFIGETDNLRHRIERHFETGGIHGLPDWLYDTRSRPMTLAILPLPQTTASNRKIIECAEVRRFRPFFNYRPAA